MNHFLSRLKRLRRENSGQDMVEYALILVFVSLLCIAAIQGLSNAINQVPNELMAQFINLYFS